MSKTLKGGNPGGRLVNPHSTSRKMGYGGNTSTGRSTNMVKKENEEYHLFGCSWICPGCEYIQQCPSSQCEIGCCPDNPNNCQILA